MHLAVRPYVTVGVAIVGATILIANPATTPSLELPSIQQAAATSPDAGAMSNTTAQASALAAQTPVDSFIAANITGGVALTHVAVNTPINLLAAAQQVAAHPDQLAAVLAALSAEQLQGVGAFAGTFPGLLTTFGPYLGSLGAGAGGVVSTAANTVIAALSGLPPSPTTAAPTAAAGTLTAPTPAESAIAAIINAGSTRTRVVINTPVNLLAAAQQVAAHPDQLPAVLAALPAQGLQTVRAVAIAEAGEISSLGPYLGSLATGAVGVVSTAANTVINTAPALLPARTVSLVAAPSTGGTNATVSSFRADLRTAVKREIGTLPARADSVVTRPMKGTRQVVRSSADVGAAVAAAQGNVASAQRRHLQMSIARANNADGGNGGGFGKHRAAG